MTTPRARALVFLATCGVGAAVLMLPTSGDGLSRAGVQAYESQLTPLVRDGGRTVEQGMKPAIADLRHDHITPPAVIAAEGDGWARELTSLRGKISAIRADADLTPVTSAFVMALDSYARAARAFGAAARATSPTVRQRLLGEGIALAQEADQRYDHASALLQGLHRKLGLPASSDYPDPARSST